LNLLIGAPPKYPSDPDLDEKLNYTERQAAHERNKSWPESKVFSLNDLTEWYENYAKHDERIKNFVEKIAEGIKTQDLFALHNFQLHELIDTEYGTARIAVIAFDTEQNGQSFDLVVKDLD
jgi:hypothetical protein